MSHAYPLACVLAAGALLGASQASAADAANGNTLYHSYCVGCHGDPPRGGPETAANSPSTIRNALNSVGAMQFLRGELTDAQIADIAAYIGSLGNPTQPPPVPEFDYSDMWWNPAESGWGMNIIQHPTNIIFGVIFTYEAPNRPTWFVLPAGTWTSPTTYTGKLYRVAGPPGNTSFRPVDVFEVGTATLLFTGESSANITYSVNGTQVAKQIQRQPF
jgi:cytochrome c553